MRISQFAEDEVLKIGYSLTLKFLYVKLGGQEPQLSSLRSPNARNKFVFALGERKLLATLKFLNVDLTGYAGTSNGTPNSCSALL